MAMTLITTNTSSNAATSDFTSSIDSTYKLYIFKMYDVNPATDNVHFGFQANVVDASGYNETITSSAFEAYHQEDDGGTPAVAYQPARDQRQGTAFQDIAPFLGNGADENAGGKLHLFNPSSTTFTTHFYSRFVCNNECDIAQDDVVSGMFNVDGAIDEIQFKMSSGNFDGKIKMWGVK